MNDLVAVCEGRALTTSLKVAEAFGLDHGVLMSDFLAKSHRLPVDFMRKNFRGCEGLGPLAYRMTRDGFSVFFSAPDEGDEWVPTAARFLMAFNEVELQLSAKRID